MTRTPVLLSKKYETHGDEAQVPATEKLGNVLRQSMTAATWQPTADELKMYSDLVDSDDDDDDDEDEALHLIVEEEEEEEEEEDDAWHLFVEEEEEEEIETIVVPEKEPKPAERSGSKPVLEKKESNTKCRKEKRAEQLTSFADTYLSKGKFEDDYELGRELGDGAFAVVNEATHKRKPDLKYAVKIIDKLMISKKSLSDLLIEIAVTKRLVHPHIVRLFKAYEGPEQYHLLQEKMIGGELLDRITEKEFYAEVEARDTVASLLGALDYMQSHKVVHRDLKPENLLLANKESDTNIKICDFGLATREIEPNSLTTLCGTPNYVAPEVLNRVPYGKQVDMWSMGTIVFLIIGGYAPFDEPDMSVQYRRIQEGDYEFIEEYWSHASENAKEFVRKLLLVDPSERMNVTESRKHTWITTSGSRMPNKIGAASFRKLKTFNMKRKLKAATNIVIASNRMSLLAESFCITEEESESEEE
jgi:calcium/calmodulin-dependent protein kinase I